MDPDDGQSQNPTPPPPPYFSSGGVPEAVPIEPPDTTSLPMASPFLEPLPFSPLLSFESFDAQFESNPVPRNEAGGGDGLLSAPQPLEALYETPVPPFLSKTLDLVDDPSLDVIISWGARGDSFVVWDPVEFARVILPRNFKHNNFSSFVRQLNTYGFRKIDTDKWEFANEGFIRGQRHMLKNIQRRKSPHSQQLQQQHTGSSSASLDEAGELERLRKERNLMMQEVVELQQQQRGTFKHMEMVNEKLQAAERRQKQMVSFLGKIFENPAVLARFQQMRQQKSITFPRTTRKFVKHQMQDSDVSPYQHEQHGDPFTPTPKLLPPVFGTEIVPFQVEDTSLSEYATIQGFPEQAEAVPTSLGIGDSFFKGKGVAVSEDSLKEKTGPEFSISGTHTIGLEEGLWSMDFGSSAGMSSSTELWGDFRSHDVPELDGGLSDVWEIGSLQRAGSSGIDKWLNEDSPFNELDKQQGQPRDDT